MRILLIRLSAIGDVVMASGLVPALRAAHPQARLAWLVEPAAAPLLAHNPRLDEVIVWPRGEWQALWRAGRLVALARRAWRFRRELRERGFDVAIDAQGLLKSAAFAWISGAPRRVTLHGREGSHRLMTERVAPAPDPLKPIGSEYRALARHLGAPAGTFRMDVVVGEAPRAVARQRLSAAGVHGRYAVLCPFTTRPQKHWFDDRWVDLAGQLARRGLVPVILGGPGDVAAAAAIAARHPRIVDLAGRLKLDETAAAIEGAALVVGVDTGLTHLGSALRVPTIALFGSTCPYLDARTPGSVVLYEKIACSPCKRHPTCGGTFDCMRLHTVERVLHVAEPVLGGTPAEDRAHGELTQDEQGLVQGAAQRSSHGFPNDAPQGLRPDVPHDTPHELPRAPSHAPSQAPSHDPLRDPSHGPSHEAASDPARHPSARRAP
jgi:heptosyltransferase-1